MDLSNIESFLRDKGVEYSKNEDGDWEVLKLNNEYTRSKFQVGIEFIFESNQLKYLSLSENKFKYFLQNFNTNILPPKFIHKDSGTFLYAIEKIGFSYFSQNYSKYINGILNELIDLISQYFEEFQENAKFEVKINENLLKPTEEIGSYIKINTSVYQELTNSQAPENFQSFTLITSPLNNKSQIKYSAYTKSGKNYESKSLISETSDPSEKIKFITNLFNSQ